MPDSNLCWVIICPDRFDVGFLSPSGKRRDITSIAYDGFLPGPFRFIVYEFSYSSMLYIPGY